MSIPLPSPEDQDSHRSQIEPSQPPAPQPAPLPGQAGPTDDTFYLYTDEGLEDGHMEYAAPFQRSGPLATRPMGAPSSGQATPPTPAAVPAPPKRARRRPLLLTLIALPVGLLLVLGSVGLAILAEMTPTGTAGKRTLPVVMKPSPARPMTHMSARPLSTVAPAPGQGGAQPFDWVPQQLPAGWANAGLSMGDAIEALRTATTFTDREMSLDFRDAGTRAHHAGTFLAATFLLTPAAQLRFVHNDVRVINNRLFDMVMQGQLMRAVVNPQPALVQFAIQGQQQFAWVDVAFQLWQSRLDPQAQQRIEGKELVASTNQPLIHHMIVLLVRVPLQEQGPQAPMGGTGWLVSTYALDPPALPAILTPA